jgi:pimeloyl-ACP methyl ester carboxylesterase
MPHVRTVKGLGRVSLAMGVLLMACSAQPAGKANAPTPVPASPSAPTATSAPTRAPAATSSGPLQPVACRASGAVSTGECYDLTVPEHHDRPNGRSIRLHVMVVKSTAPNRVQDPILFLMGGPGSPGIAAYLWASGSFSPFYGRRDVIVLDQRGTGS